MQAIIPKKCKKNTARIFGRQSKKYYYAVCAISLSMARDWRYSFASAIFVMATSALYCRATCSISSSDTRNHAVKRTVARPGRQARAAGAVRHHARRKEIERAGEHNPAALRIVQRDGTAGKGVFAGRDGVQQLSDAVSSHGFFICSQAAGRRSRPSPAVLHGFRSPRPLRVRAPRSGRHPGSC